MGTTKAAALRAVVAIVVVLLIVFVACYVSGHRCFLDVLNAQISKQTQFEAFYAASDGRWGLPAPGDVVPGLERLDAAYPEIRAEMEAAMFSGRDAGEAADSLPPMHEMYNNIFMYKGSASRNESLAQRVMRPLQRAFGTFVYGKDTDIFDKIGSDDWRTFNLLMFGHPVPGNADKCPRTLQLLQSVPGIQSALFSVVKPGAYIPPHRDPAKGVIRYHLALRVPQPVVATNGVPGQPPERRCYIEVDCDHGPGCPADDYRHRYRWEEGQSVLFDDVHSHWVQNDTDEVRVILFVDVLRPLSGSARALQGLANFANRYHPGVRRLIRESRV